MIGCLLYCTRSRFRTSTCWWGRCRSDVQCLAEAVSPFTAKVVAAEALPDQNLLVCGDQGGHVFAYHLPSSLTRWTPERGAAPVSGVIPKSP